MADILTIGFWIIIINSIIAGLVETTLFVYSINEMGKIAGLKKSLFLIFISSIITISFSICIAVFGIAKYSIASKWWIVIPISFILIGINSVPIVSTFKKSIQQIQEKGIEKIKQEELEKIKQEELGKGF